MSKLWKWKIWVSEQELKIQHHRQNAKMNDRISDVENMIDEIEENAKYKSS